MANQNFLHTAEIMKATLPYMNTRNKITLEFMSKIFDLMGSLSMLTGSNSMVACGYENETIDVEGLLTGIRPLCNNKERDFIDRILNIFNAKRMFEMYNNLMSMMKTMPGFDGFPFSDSDSKDDTDNVTGNFTGNNYDSIFRTFGIDPEKNNSGEDSSSEYSNDTDHNSKDAFSQDNAMYEMLKTMVPPEQMSTFENLRMLLSTMSYDNNSKPDDSKEHDNG